MAPRAGFEPARVLVNSQVPSQLGYLGMKMVGDPGRAPGVSWSQARRDATFPCPRENIRLSKILDADSNRDPHLRTVKSSSN